MCLGLPGQVVDVTERDGIAMGKVQFGGVSRQVCLAHVPDVRPGDWVLVHVGFALARLAEDEARRVFAILEEMGELLDLEQQAAGDAEPEDAA
jgi:hydrogenase expression/formation protein HypC